jgi:hypothetical protein
MALMKVQKQGLTLIFMKVQKQGSTLIFIVLWGSSLFLREQSCP